MIEPFNRSVFILIDQDSDRSSDRAPSVDTSRTGLKSDRSHKTTGGASTGFLATGTRYSWTTKPAFRYLAVDNPGEERVFMAHGASGGSTQVFADDGARDPARQDRRQDQPPPVAECATNEFPLATVATILHDH